MLGALGLCVQGPATRWRVVVGAHAVAPLQSLCAETVEDQTFEVEHVSFVTSVVQCVLACQTCSVQAGVRASWALGSGLSCLLVASVSRDAENNTYVAAASWQLLAAFPSYVLARVISFSLVLSALGGTRVAVCDRGTDALPGSVNRTCRLC